jgi:mannose-6-phosphate isomerase-like protein (cupin superfamily)
VEPQTVYRAERHEQAPDGSIVYPLVKTGVASVGLILLDVGQISAPVSHRTVEEIWYVLEGYGHIWRNSSCDEQVVDLAPGTCITIPAGTAFQFRASLDGPMRILMLTVPAWPDDDEAEEVPGYWQNQPRR